MHLRQHFVFISTSAHLPVRTFALLDIALVSSAPAGMNCTQGLGFTPTQSPTLPES